ncbi:molecular chaperone TorD family protein [Bacillus sp. DNRA2]|uniref:TorD/DmsD family molecular chaperone n=1 Tax=Bacillus sp. DNRA2 TaxID=2723053 RepID=UPI00145E9B52|nr:molecular chaperone TorD family protein [Bacillus sp. DNRA2]NMD70049.1 molecular chaperone TorD family protein [Bacillus sp. DNRA2]
MQQTIALPLVDIFKARQYFYQFIQVLFFEPVTKETLAQLQNSNSLDDLRNIEEAGEHLYQFFAHTTEAELHDAKEEFYRLFIGPETILTPPWESVYRSKEGLLFEETTFQVREHYHRHNLEFIKENQEPDDHIAIELEFILHLNQLCLQNVDNYRLKKLVNHQIEFHEQHMQQWIPAFTTKILNHTDHSLYKGAALLLREFTVSDYHTLLDLKEAL